jgi:subfamily B ATP-binding cassette protein MsbA
VGSEINKEDGFSPQNRKRLNAIYEAATFRPLLGGSIVLLGLVTALLEGIGLGFLLPIIEFTQSSSPSGSAGRVLELFIRLYSFLGIPFTMEYLIAGVATVMTVRFSMSFLTGWLRSVLNAGYQRALRQDLFEALAYAPIEYIDEAGSDELLNSLISEASRAGSVISALFALVETFLRGMIYFIIAAALSVQLTLLAVVGLGASTLFIRFVIEPADTVGEELAEVNEELQSASQTVVYGTRDIRLFNLRGDMVERMRNTVDRFFQTRVRFGRNRSALDNANQLTNALVVFALVYAGLEFSTLSLGEVGVFLFAVYRLSPAVTQMNSTLYSLYGALPQVVRVQERIEELKPTENPAIGGERSVQSVDRIEFNHVSFVYSDRERVLNDVSFSVKRAEHIALVGQSGAGKSTVVALLGRLRIPNSGQILADGRSIQEFNLGQWRDRLAVVRQDPYIFNDTLSNNITIGNRGASQRAVEKACEVAQVTEFIDSLPNGYESELGEDAVRLSGGQKQRVAIARALLKDADVFVFDEATSELDSNIERDVYAGIAAMRDEYAIISIAHRLSTVKNADRIYVLKDGVVAEVGTHQELLTNGKTYAKLYATQSEDG